MKRRDFIAGIILAPIAFPLGARGEATKQFYRAPTTSSNEALTSVIGTKRTCQPRLAMSSVDGSRIARAKLTQWHWSGAVFCPAC